MVKFKNIAALKRQPVGKPAIRFPSGFPTPMGKQMAQPIKRKLKFPSPNPPASEREIRQRVKKAQGREERPRFT